MIHVFPHGTSWKHNIHITSPCCYGQSVNKELSSYTSSRICNMSTHLDLCFWPNNKGKWSFNLIVSLVWSLPTSEENKQSLLLTNTSLCLSASRQFLVLSSSCTLDFSKVFVQQLPAAARTEDDECWEWTKTVRTLTVQPKQHNRCLCGHQTEMAQEGKP